MSFAQLGEWSQLHVSAQVVWVADLVCLIGALVTLYVLYRHARAPRVALAGAAVPAGGEAEARSATSGTTFLERLPTVLMYGSLVVLAGWVWVRWQETNHFPSQTMSEVLTMFTLALVISMVVLHHVLALHRRSNGWAVVDDALMLLIFASVVYTHVHVRTLVTAQRDLPPALQSYWFPPHLSSLIFSYATLGIAGLIALIYFSTRFWSGFFQGGYSRRSQWWVFLGLVLIPFAHFVTIPVLAITGLVFLVLHKRGRLPSRDTVAALEKELDQVSFRAFAVGIPFLTAGLWMGAFWAQEAWANYWGWDSKENSALISWLIYIVYIHLRMLGGYRGEKAMAVLLGGALSIFLTFQVFGYLPDSQKSLHRYTDDGVVPQEGQQGAVPTEEAAKLEGGAGEASR